MGLARPKAAMGIESRPDARKGVRMPPHGCIDLGLTRSRELKHPTEIGGEARVRPASHSPRNPVQRQALDRDTQVFPGKTEAATSPGKAMASPTAAETATRRSVPCSHLLD